MQRIRLVIQLESIISEKCSYVSYKRSAETEQSPVLYQNIRQAALSYVASKYLLAAHYSVWFIYKFFAFSSDKVNSTRKTKFFKSFSSSTFILEKPRAQIFFWNFYCKAMKFVRKFLDKFNVQTVAAWWKKHLHML